MMKYGLADSKDANDLAIMLESLRENWENVCPEFREWFVSKRKSIFWNNVIECARKNTNVHGLFYNNSTKCQHNLEKKEQSFRKRTVKDVIKNVKVTRGKTTRWRGESYLQIVRLTSWTKIKKKVENRLPSKIPMPLKRYCMNYFSVQWYRAWQIDTRKTVGRNCFQWTKKIILW